MSKNNFYLIILVVILALLVVLFASGKLTWRSNNTNLTDTTVQSNPAQLDTPEIETDSQLNQQPTSKAPTTQTPVQPTSSVTQDKEDILQALVDKNGFDISAIQMTYSEITSTHAMGGVSPKDGEIGGGYWFAAKDSTGQWVIAADGNGTIECSDIEPYNFPTSMISECYNSVTGKVVVR